MLELDYSHEYVIYSADVLVQHYPENSHITIKYFGDLGFQA